MQEHVEQTEALSLHVLLIYMTPATSKTLANDNFLFNILFLNKTVSIYLIRQPNHILYVTVRDLLNAISFKSLVREGPFFEG